MTQYKLKNSQVSDDSLRSSDRLESYWSIKTNKRLGNSEPTKRKSHLFSGLISFPVFMSQQSQAYQAKIAAMNTVTTEPTSHPRSPESSTFVICFYRPTETQAYLAEAVLRRSQILAVLRDGDSLIARRNLVCIFLGILNLIALGFTLGLERAVAVFVHCRALVHSSQITLILRMRARAAIWICGSKIRRIAVVCSHITLLAILTMPQTCPLLKTDQGWLPCSNILSYYRERTLGHTESAKKLLAITHKK